MNAEAPTNKPIIIGQISGVFGVHGWVKIFSHTEPRENILQYQPWLIKDKSGWHSLSVIKGRKQGKTIVAQIKGIDDREKAHAMIGCDIAINESQLKKLDDDDFYWRELEGLKVINIDGVEFGKLSKMMATGANDVMVIKLTEALAKEKEVKETLIPYLMGSVIKKVSIQEGSIEVDWDADFE